VQQAWESEIPVQHTEPYEELIHLIADTVVYGWKCPGWTLSFQNDEGEQISDKAGDTQKKRMSHCIPRRVKVWYR
jgi:hypothetical protein